MTPAPRPHPDPRPDDAEDQGNIRVAELLERDHRGELTTEESAELREMLRLDPALRAERESIEVAARSSRQVLDAAVTHFDFDRARRAIRERLRLDTLRLRMLLIGAPLAPAIAVAAGLPAPDWTLVVVLTAVFGAQCAVFGVIAHVRRRRGMAALDAGGLLLPQTRNAFAVSGRNEHALLQAAAIIISVALVLMVIDAVLDRTPARVTIAVLLLVVVAPPLLRRAFAPSHRRRLERFLAGSLSASAWMHGSDEPAPREPASGGPSSDDSSSGGPS